MSVNSIMVDENDVSGGKITFDKDQKTILVHGYSKGFGQSDHNIGAKLIESKYLD